MEIEKIYQLTSESFFTAKETRYFLKEPFSMQKKIITEFSIMEFSASKRNLLRKIKFTLKIEYFPRS